MTLLTDSIRPIKPLNLEAHPTSASIPSLVVQKLRHSGEPQRLGFRPNHFVKATTDTEDEKLRERFAMNLTSSGRSESISKSSVFSVNLHLARRLDQSCLFGQRTNRRPMGILARNPTKPVISPCSGPQCSGSPLGRPHGGTQCRLASSHGGFAGHVCPPGQ